MALLLRRSHRDPYLCFFVFVRASKFMSGRDKKQPCRPGSPVEIMEKFASFSQLYSAFPIIKSAARSAFCRLLALIIRPPTPTTAPAHCIIFSSFIQHVGRARAGGMEGRESLYYLYFKFLLTTSSFLASIQVIFNSLAL